MLDDDSAHYIRHVLRMKSGGVVETFDGTGGIDSWEISEISRKAVELKHQEHIDVERRSPVNLTLGLNPLKGGSEEVAIRMAAAMEVIAISPVFFARSEVPFDNSILIKRLDRWRRLCISEVALSGGAYLPEILKPVRFIDIAVPQMSHTILFYEDVPPTEHPRVFDPDKTVVALIGPEGGLEKDEVAHALEKGIEIASLGHWTLRAELAATLVPSWVYSKIEKK